MIKIKFILLFCIILFINVRCATQESKNVEVKAIAKENETVKANSEFGMRIDKYTPVIDSVIDKKVKKLVS